MQKVGVGENPGKIDKNAEYPSSVAILWNKLRGNHLKWKLYYLQRRKIPFGLQEIDIQPTTDVFFWILCLGAFSLFRGRVK